MPYPSPPAPGAGVHIRPVAIRPIGMESGGPPPAPAQSAPSFVALNFNPIPVVPPKGFTGEKRDWRRFRREALQYDMDMRSNGAVSEAQRVRILRDILDDSARTRVTLMQHEARDGRYELTS